jgi:hypothetical protein
MATLTAFPQPDYANTITGGGDKNPTQAFVQTANGTPVTTATIAKAYTSNTVLGNMLFAVARVSSTVTAGTLTCADNINGAWTALPTIVLTGTTVAMQAFYFLNGAGGATTVTVTNTGGSGTQTLDLTIGEWYGANTIDQHVEGTASSTLTPASGSVTTGHKDICIGYAAEAGAATTWSNTGDATYTVRTANTEVASFSDKLNIAAGSISFTDTYTVIANAAAGLATFYMAGPNAVGVLKTTESSGPITVGQHRLIHISGMNTGTQSNRCALSYTMGLSTGTTAPTPTNSSPFVLGDEGWAIDTGFYDQINIANQATYNGAATVQYSVSILSKF